MTDSNLQRRIVSVPANIAVKWSEAVLDEGFVPFPKRLLRCLSQLFEDIEDVQVILTIADYARQKLLRPPSYEYLAFNAGLTVSEMKMRVAKMEARNWLTATGPDELVTIRMDGLLREIAAATDDETRPSVEDGASET